VCGFGSENCLLAGCGVTESRRVEKTSGGSLSVVVSVIYLFTLSVYVTRQLALDISTVVYRVY
jgi:hypothetical protein